MATTKTKSKPNRPSTSKSGKSKSKRRPNLKHRSAAAIAKVPDTSISGGRAAAANMLDALGGKESVIAILADSAHPKAQKLLDRLQSTVHAGENFATSYTSVGLKAIDVLEIFGDVQQARVMIQALQQGDQVMRSLIRAANDQIVVHDKCEGTGKILDSKKQETDESCKKCMGSGYILLPGSRESQQLYFELVSWKKSGGMINIDARKQQVAVLNAGQGTVVGAVGGGAPDIVQIIKRADQVQLALPAHESSKDTDQMPEDVIEAEQV